MVWLSYSCIHRPSAGFNTSGEDVGISLWVPFSSSFVSLCNFERNKCYFYLWVYICVGCMYDIFRCTCTDSECVGMCTESMSVCACRGQRSVSGVTPQEVCTLVIEAVSLIVTWSSLTWLVGKNSCGNRASVLQEMDGWSYSKDRRSS